MVDGLHICAELVLDLAAVSTMVLTSPCEHGAIHRECYCGPVIADNAAIRLQFCKGERGEVDVLAHFWQVVPSEIIPTLEVRLGIDDAVSQTA